MQIYTQNLNLARKNMIFFKKVNKSTGLRVNEFLGSLKGLFWVCSGSAWVCFGSVKKIHLFNPLNPIYT